MILREDTINKSLLENIFKIAYYNQDKNKTSKAEIGKENYNVKYE